jgi:hypothetical protein
MYVYKGLGDVFIMEDGNETPNNSAFEGSTEIG